MTRNIAKHLISLASPLPPNAHILDNACGPGIVIDELLPTISSSAKSSISIIAVDAAPAMINVVSARAEKDWKLSNNQVVAKASPGEDLAVVEDGWADVSFTNFGIMFFKDPEQGSRELYRTLKKGGTAFVTTWREVGYLRAVRIAEAEIRKGKKEVAMPFGDEWFEAGTLEGVLRKAGFEDVGMSEVQTGWKSKDLEDMSQAIGTIIGGLFRANGASEEEAGMLPGALKRIFEGGYGDELTVEEGEPRMRMVAHVAVCRK